MSNRTKRTPKKRQIILDAISRGLTIAEAAQAAGMGRRTVSEWRTDDAEFAREFENAYDAGTDCYEAEARKRAFDQSDALLIFLLKQRDPKRFNQKTLMVAGDPDNPLTVTHHDDDQRVFFFMPSNGRDQPEQVEADEPMIEGTVTDDATDNKDIAA